MKQLASLFCLINVGAKVLDQTESRIHLCWPWLYFPLCLHSISLSKTPGAALLTWFLLRDHCSSMSSSLSTSPLRLEAVSQPLSGEIRESPGNRGEGKFVAFGDVTLCLALKTEKRRWGDEGGTSWLTDRGGGTEGVNAGQGVHSIVMSCEAPANERDGELGRLLVLFQFKDFHLLQTVTEEESH